MEPAIISCGFVRTADGEFVDVRRTTSSEDCALANNEYPIAQVLQCGYLAVTQLGQLIEIGSGEAEEVIEMSSPVVKVECEYPAILLLADGSRVVQDMDDPYDFAPLNSGHTQIIKLDSSHIYLGVYKSQQLELLDSANLRPIGIPVINLNHSRILGACGTAILSLNECDQARLTSGNTVVDLDEIRDGLRPIYWRSTVKGVTSVLLPGYNSKLFLVKFRQLPEYTVEEFNLDVVAFDENRLVTSGGNLYHIDPKKIGTSDPLEFVRAGIWVGEHQRKVKSAART